MSAQHAARPVPPPRPGDLFREFVRSNVTSGVLLMAAATLALIWSNSPLAASYDALWTSKLPIGLGGAQLSLTLQHWINDGLMAIFFLAVGLEIKREVRVGQLASPARAMLPAAGALGGAIVPALIFLAVVGPSADGARGWGVPMATDIAFALGVLALVGKRVPPALKLFVTALAVVDDLLAVMVIALFYTGGVDVPALAAAAGIVVALLLVNRSGVRSLWVYAGLGILLWLAVYESGIHATVAGVVLALTIPGPRPHHQNGHSPLERLEHMLGPFVTLAIVPLFALANSGIFLADAVAAATDPVVLGVFLGLILGKQIGITVTVGIVERLNIAEMPQGLKLRHIYAASWVCAIGFTMSLFIAELAFEGTPSLDAAKVGILAASVVAGVVGLALVRFVSARLRTRPAT
jgi:NhaA family Na+:H+ antiporter